MIPSDRITCNADTPVIVNKYSYYIICNLSGDFKILICTLLYFMYTTYFSFKYGKYRYRLKNKKKQKQFFIMQRCANKDTYKFQNPQNVK